MSTSLVLMIDDTDGSISYAGGTWSHSTDTQWYQNSETWAKFAQNTTHLGTFTVKFEGTGISISLTGSTPAPSFSQDIHITIDNGSPSSLTFPIPQRYMQWYQSPTLNDGFHTLTVANLEGAVGVDFALVQVGQNTPLSGKTAVVDDDDSVVQYSGSWSRSTEQFNPGVLLIGFPFGGATHRSSTPGDTITFQFFGTSVAVYGLFLWGSLGSLSMMYTVDGNAFPKTYTVTVQSPEYTANYGDTENFLYFSQESLSSGNHTLVIRIESALNQIFILDYLTYNPSFSTLSALPNLVPSQTTASGAFTKSSSQDPSDIPNSSPYGSQPRSSSHSMGAAIGASVCGTLLVILFAFLILKWRKNRRQKGEHNIQVTAAICEATNAQLPPFLQTMSSCTIGPGLSPFILDPGPRSSSKPARALDHLTRAGAAVVNTTSIPLTMTIRDSSAREDCPPAYYNIA